MNAWTDYPITQLGDAPGQLAPIREVTILGWDGDKYVRIKVDGVVTSIKYGYLYTEPGRDGSAQVVSVEALGRDGMLFTSEEAER